MKTFTTPGKKMNTLQVALGLYFLMISAQATAQQITTPRTASPAATAIQTIGISTIRVDYSRPAVKGRKIWGALVPYGWNVDSFGAQNLRWKARRCETSAGSKRSSAQ